MIVELSKIKNADELREKATYKYNGNKQIEEMSEKGKLVYITNENYQYLDKKANRHGIEIVKIVNGMIEYFKNHPKNNEGIDYYIENNLLDLEKQYGLIFKEEDEQ